ncbi:hypothetical protein [Symbiopectobacterium purcellii]|uniref:hypothetical protein n=1 Tax=Symbiopectobacterium purcellii TaxID=2871826 RepID=UPI003F8678AB
MKDIQKGGEVYTLNNEEAAVEMLIGYENQTRVELNKDTIGPVQLKLIEDVVNLTAAAIVFGVTYSSTDAPPDKTCLDLNITNDADIILVPVCINMPPGFYYRQSLSPLVRNSQGNLIIECNSLDQDMLIKLDFVAITTDKGRLDPINTLILQHQIFIKNLTPLTSPL